MTWAQAYTGLSLMVYPLFLCNWRWIFFSRLYLRTVPGSLQRAQIGAQRRAWRWPGFALWPVALACYPRHFFPPDDAFNTVLAAPLLVMILGCGWVDWRRLRRELDEDDQDWFNRAKKGLRRALQGALGGMAAPQGA